MSKQAFIVTGLGYGDEGKGSIVDWLVHQHQAHTVIRTGGPQALHRVVTSDGREHVFSQFGSGALRGAWTHLSKHMLVAPDALLREAAVLAPKCGFHPFTRLTVHQDTPVIFPIHAIAGRIRELLRGNNARGTVGVGVGETVRDTSSTERYVMRAADFAISALPELVRTIWEQKIVQYRPLVANAHSVGEPYSTEIIHHWEQMLNVSYMNEFIRKLLHLRDQLQIVNDTYVADTILHRNGTVVFEGSQGVLLDRVYGFYPYTTKVRATPETAQAILGETGYSGHTTSLGVVRSYATRHGHGPFVTESQELTNNLPDAANQTDPWQGNFRVGHFDAVLARYAATACGTESIDGLVVTCLDRTSALDTWSICTSYQMHTDVHLQTDNNRQPVTSAISELSACGTQIKSEVLTNYRPVLRSFDLRPLSMEKRQQRQVDEITHLVSIPLYGISLGETERNKIKV